MKIGLNSYINRAPEAESGAAAETFDNVAVEATDNILDVLHFDPFPKGSEIPQEAERKPVDNDKAASGEGNETNAPPAQAPERKEAESTKPAQDDQVKHWRELAERYQELYKEKAGTKEEPVVDDKPKLPQYDFNIPDELIGALTGDDLGKFKQGVSALAKGIAMATHAQMVKHLEEAMSPRFAAIPELIQTMANNQRQLKTVHDDFYGKYPELNHPELKGFVKTIGEQVAKELGKKAWDAELRDSTAKRVKEILSVTTGKKTEAKAPPKMLPSQGARPSTQANDASAEIVDVLFGDY